MLNEQVEAITEAVIQRSVASRGLYLERIDLAAARGRQRASLSCSNLAHGVAACGADTKAELKGESTANIAIISAYNDMLSAHQPYRDVPEQLKRVIEEAGAVAQFAGGVPAMCDGVTQGQPGMELSLFSRDVIAMSTAIALSHNMFDGVLLLGICDKIVPGLLMGALAFGHLPALFVPSGPMLSGLPNDEKAKVRRLYAEGKVDRDALLEAETASYHSPGTCTFYGTANSNQMLMEIMGLHLPGASFVNPGTAIREQFNEAAGRRIAAVTHGGNDFRPLGRVIDERAIVNGMVGLLATGGSTNHTIHLVAMARAAGIQITWDDFAALSSRVPLLTRVYPSGSADVNHFHAAGGMAALISELLEAGLLHEDIMTMGQEHGLSQYRSESELSDGVLRWLPGPTRSRDLDVIASAGQPFAAEGGLRLLRGNLGRCVIKSSAVAREHWQVEAPAMVFNDQDEAMRAYHEGLFSNDIVVVLRYQGPRANGMPELHQLTPALSSLQAQGFKVALITDGRMSGASGKIPAAIHVTPEALDGGPLARVKSGDKIRLDIEAGELTLLVSEEELDQRIVAAPDLSANEVGMGRELFAAMRASAGSAESGASSFDLTEQGVLVTS